MQPCGSAAVYDLTVDEHHEFFANGILVSNCYEDTGRFFEARPHAMPARVADPLRHLDPISRAEAKRVETAHAPAKTRKGVFRGFGR